MCGRDFSKLKVPDIKVRGGEWDTQHTNEPFETQDVFAKQVKWLFWTKLDRLKMNNSFILRSKRTSLPLQNQVESSITNYFLQMSKQKQGSAYIFWCSNMLEKTESRKEKKR